MTKHHKQPTKDSKVPDKPMSLEEFDRKLPQELADNLNRHVLALDQKEKAS